MMSRIATGYLILDQLGSNWPKCKFKKQQIKDVEQAVAESLWFYRPWSIASSCCTLSELHSPRNVYIPKRGPQTKQPPTKQAKPTKQTDQTSQTEPPNNPPPEKSLVWGSQRLFLWLGWFLLDRCNGDIARLQRLFAFPVPAFLYLLSQS